MASSHAAEFVNILSDSRFVNENSLILLRKAESSIYLFQNNETNSYDCTKNAECGRQVEF